MSRTLEKLNLLDDPTRLKLYTSLLQEELCECELPDVIGSTMEDLSRHLEILAENDLIESEERDGSTFFEARSNPLEEVRDLVRKKESEEWYQLQERIVSAKNKHRFGSLGPVQSEISDEAFVLN